uniref:Fibronectin type III-like domain-containing protein n=1 Tax=Setaria viridis TaxID=4556 RepID=A0A4U6V069_SETVI|nr:hypothetical protein SEVIR_4G135500v2 [Setaria viridis]
MAPPSHPLVVVLAATLLLCSTTIPVASSAAATTTVNITSFGKAYTKVCDAEQFTEHGLDMSAFLYYHTPTSTGPTTLFDDLHRRPGNHSSRATAHYSNNNGTVSANIIISAASFNETLWKSIGLPLARYVVSTEARAMYNLGKGGLTYWSPNINVVQDPRWGRALETPGEDPFVAGRYAVNFVRGMQDIPGHEPGAGDDPYARPIRTGACCKHYAAYDVDDWHNHTRFTFDARVSERDMAETFLRPFEMCVRDGDASSVMCSYNRINGVPACADARLLSGTVRGDWQLHGYIVSDCDAVRVMTDNATWLNFTAADSGAAALRAGLDLDCCESWLVDEEGRPVRDFLSVYGMVAVAEGKIRESDIDNALSNLLARDGARQGMVLLKNDGDLLPLDPKKIPAIAVHGPHARAPEKVMDGDYTGISKDVKISHRANTTIYFGGINLHIEREGNDREDILLPKNQTEEILHFAAAAPNPIILVILSGGGIDLSFAQNHPKIGAILWAGYPGGEGGDAIADVIFGRYNPGGRLPLTWYKNKYIQQIPMTSMEFRPVPELGYPGRTYKFHDGPEVLYPFGYGLSYTKFLYETGTTGAAVTIPVPGGHCKGLSYKPSATATPACQAVNVDGHACTETVSFNVDQAPIKQVAAFRRVFVPAKGAETVPFTLNMCKAFGIVERTAYTVVPSGVSKVLVENGDASSSVSFPVKIELAV